MKSIKLGSQKEKTSKESDFKYNDELVVKAVPQEGRVKKVKLSKKLLDYLEQDRENAVNYVGYAEDDDGVYIIPVNEELKDNTHVKKLNQGDISINYAKLFDKIPDTSSYWYVETTTVLFDDKEINAVYIPNSSIRKVEEESTDNTAEDNSTEETTEEAVEYNVSEDNPF